MSEEEVPAPRAYLMCVNGPNRGQSFEAILHVPSHVFVANHTWKDREAVYEVVHEGRMWYLNYLGWKDELPPPTRVEDPALAPRQEIFDVKPRKIE
jgi:hypothetical protein